DGGRAIPRDVPTRVDVGVLSSLTTDGDALFGVVSGANVIVRVEPGGQRVVVAGNGQESPRVDPPDGVFTESLTALPMTMKAVTIDPATGLLYAATGSDGRVLE